MRCYTQFRPANFCENVTNVEKNEKKLWTKGKRIAIIPFTNKTKEVMNWGDETTDTADISFGGGSDRCKGSTDQ